MGDTKLIWKEEDSAFKLMVPLRARQADSSATSTRTDI